ncbi:transcription elongation factor SPT5 [Scomber scombrus]|uniref:transcription elongation factor SPT5 n=1 Tax=Scomber scombrus TaxID=13677 RepID=UPI002DD8022E|nr:transcription elongation factor SPT5 [Scomber scombrus]
MSDSDDSDFSDNQSDRSSDGEAEEVEENEEETNSPVGSDKVAEEEGEDLEDEEEYDEEEEEDDDDRPRKKPRHGGFILDEADVDDEYEDEEDQWEEGAEDILEKEEAEVSNIDHVVLDEDHSGSRRLQNLWRDSREEALGEYYMRKFAKSSGGEHVVFELSAAGNRTPHYGSQTPLHDGSRTPGQSGAWDPHNPNTPSRNDEEYDFGYDDEPSPSPQGYGGTPNPQTPGYPEVPSPQVNPQYNPQTPGTPAMYNTEQYSPYAAPSPQGSYQPSPSPQSYHQVAPSPVGYQNTHSPASYHPTPSPMAYQASPSPSPVGYSPMTPGAPSPGGYNPHTPGSNIEQGGSDWVTTDILVKVKDSFMDLMGQTGVIRSVTGGMCSVFMQESEKVVSISSDHLEPVTPTKNNKVKVILGEDREATGILLSIDGDDGIVRMELDDQLKILNLRFLGRLEH